MALADPYAPCPCGSGEKFKWCCQKAEAFAERSLRLYDNGQHDLALEALDEGLRKEPENSLLNMRKALILSSEGKPELARPMLEGVVRRHPQHSVAWSLLVRIDLECDGLIAGVSRFQQALSACPADRRASLAPTAQLVGICLIEAGQYPAGLKLLRNSKGLAGQDDPAVESSLRMVESDPAISPLLKERYPFSPAPDGLPPDVKERFDQALAWAEEGLWASAAAAFETLSADKVAPVADRNLGLCRLWLADNQAASDAFGRYVLKAGESDEVVELEALRQSIGGADKDDMVERVQLIWPVRKRDELLAALRGTREIREAGRAPLDPYVEDSPEADVFALLDRPAIEPAEGLRTADLPRVLARILVGQEIVALEALDDDRLGALGDRFTVAAGTSIAPAHPRTKVIDALPRSSLPFMWEFALPEPVNPEDLDRWNAEEHSRILREVWPNTPLPYFNGRTALQAAKSGDARVALRAAVLRMELLGGDPTGNPDFAALRSLLGLPPEPDIDPETMDLPRVPLARLHNIIVEKLADARLVQLYRTARAYGLSMALNRAARAIIERPSLFEHAVSVTSVYGDLANMAGARHHLDEALDWVRRGREAEPAAQRGRNAPAWDLLEVQLKARLVSPEEWVPDLAIVMDRYGEDQAANQIILSTLVNMGLIQLVPSATEQGKMVLDPRRLQALLNMYGPKVATSAGRLGVAATKGGIWTPGGPSSGGSSGLWTPGSPSGQPTGEGDKPKLIIPGR